jgi:hypothetical protein
MPDEPKNLENISQDDIEAVSERLKEWIPTLPEQEQLVLGWIMTRAASADTEAAAKYAEQLGSGVPVSALMAEAAGLQEVSGYVARTEGAARISPIDIGPVKIWSFRW